MTLPGTIWLLDEEQSRKSTKEFPDGQVVIRHSCSQALRADHAIDAFILAYANAVQSDSYGTSMPLGTLVVLSSGHSVVREGAGFVAGPACIRMPASADERTFFLQDPGEGVSSPGAKQNDLAGTLSGETWVRGMTAWFPRPEATLNGPDSAYKYIAGRKRLLVKHADGWWQDGPAVSDQRLLAGVEEILDYGSDPIDARTPHGKFYIQDDMVRCASVGHRVFAYTKRVQTDVAPALIPHSSDRTTLAIWPDGSSRIIDRAGWLRPGPKVVRANGDAMTLGVTYTIYHSTKHPNELTREQRQGRMYIEFKDTIYRHSSERADQYTPFAQLIRYDPFHKYLEWTPFASGTVLMSTAGESWVVRRDAQNVPRLDRGPKFVADDPDWFRKLDDVAAQPSPLPKLDHTSMVRVIAKVPCAYPEGSFEPGEFLLNGLAVWQVQHDGDTRVVTFAKRSTEGFRYGEIAADGKRFACIDIDGGSIMRDDSDSAWIRGPQFVDHPKFGPEAKSETVATDAAKTWRPSPSDAVFSLSRQPQEYPDRWAPGRLLRFENWIWQAQSDGSLLVVAYAREEPEEARDDILKSYSGSCDAVIFPSGKSLYGNQDGWHEGPAFLQYSHPDDRAQKYAGKIDAATYVPSGIDNTFLGCTTGSQPHAYHHEATTTMSNSNYIAQPGKLSQAIDTLKDDAGEAGTRVLARQFVKLTKEPLVALLSRNLAPDDDGMRAKISAFMETEIGTAVMQMLLASALMAVPANGFGGEAAANISRELRIECLADAGDMLMEIVGEPLRKILSESLAGTPKIRVSVLGESEPTPAEPATAVATVSEMKTKRA